MPTDEDDNTLTVDDLPDILSETEKDILRQHISDQGTCTLTEECMIRSFTSFLFMLHAANEHQCVHGTILCHDKTVNTKVINYVFTQTGNT